MEEPLPSATDAPPEAEETEPEGSEATDDDETAAVSDDVVLKVLQLVLDDPELTKWLHLGEPGRFPLKIKGDDLPSGGELTKNNEPVEIVNEVGDGDAVLEFSEIDVKPDSAYIKVRYDIEGMRGSVSVVKGEYGWEVDSTRFVERRAPE